MRGDTVQSVYVITGWINYEGSTVLGAYISWYEARKALGYIDPYDVIELLEYRGTEHILLEIIHKPERRHHAQSYNPSTDNVQ